MTARRHNGTARPGYGDTARVINPTSGKEWYGEVLVWSSRGEPWLRDAETAEGRWFPASWIKATIGGPPDFDRGPCSCKESDETGPQGEVWAETDRACPHHGDPAAVAAAILKRERPRA